MTQLLGIILTHNEAFHIEDCIRSLAFADAVLVFDSYSGDQTVPLAEKAGAVVIQQVFKDYPSQRNAALEAADRVLPSAEWVLFVDADERVTPELAVEVRHVIEQQGYAGWRVPRDNYIFGRLTRGAGWFPDYQTRLLRLGASRYDPSRQVHELVILDGKLGTLESRLVHYNYRDMAQFAEKQRRYSAYDARIMYEEGLRPRPHNYILQPLRHFWWRFVTLKGYIDGLHGLRLSLLMAINEYRKYWLLGQLWRLERREKN